MRGPQCLKPGDKIRSGRTTGPGCYVTHAKWGVRTAVERVRKSEVACKGMWCLCHPCRVGGRQRLRAVGKTTRATQVGLVATSPIPLWGGPKASNLGTKREVGQQVHLVSTPSRLLGRSASLHSGGQNHKLANKWVCTSWGSRGHAKFLSSPSP